MRFHVLSPPHTIARKDYSLCPFTQNVVNWCKMMHARGHTIYHYGHADSVVECTEQVALMRNEDSVWSSANQQWLDAAGNSPHNPILDAVFNERAIQEISTRKRRHDFLLTFWGYPQKPVVDAHPDLTAVEPAIGTFNVCTPHSIFASYSVMNYIYGKNGTVPKWYDAVIPHYADTADFEFNDTPADYFLFVGRILHEKGLGIAIDMTRRIGAKLIVAGKGSVASIVNPVPDHVMELGPVTPEQRCRLMKNAKALIAPTHYNEPFGMVVLESMLCGTPVITTDWGAFSETNLHGVTGYRCRTMEQFVWAGKHIDAIRRQDCRDWATKNYSLARVGLMYEEYFETLERVISSGGFYTENPDRTELDWLTRQYPAGS